MHTICLMCVYTSKSFRFLLKAGSLYCLLPTVFFLHPFGSLLPAGFLPSTGWYYLLQAGIFSYKPSTTFRYYFLRTGTIFYQLVLFSTSRYYFLRTGIIFYQLVLFSTSRYYLLPTGTDHSNVIVTTSYDHPLILLFVA